MCELSTRSYRWESAHIYWKRQTVPKRRGLDLKLIGRGTYWEPEECVVHLVVPAEITALCVLVLRARSIKVKGERDNHQPHYTQLLP